MDKRNTRKSKRFKIKKKLIIFKKVLYFRQIGVKIFESSIFHYFIVLVVIINSVTLGIEGSMDENYRNEVIDVFNIVFVSIFTIESSLKLFSYGIRGIF